MISKNYRVLERLYGPREGSSVVQRIGSFNFQFKNEYTSRRSFSKLIELMRRYFNIDICDMAEIIWRTRMPKCKCMYPRTDVSEIKNSIASYI